MRDKSKPFTVCIAKDGSITSVYSDTLQLSQLGDLCINRATDIRFSNSEQEWQIVFLAPFFKGETVISGFYSRSSAATFEVAYLNKYLKELQ